MAGARTFLKKFNQIKTLPHLAIRLSKMISDDDSSIEEFEEVIKMDPTLVLRMMRLVNSSFYGLRNKAESISAVIVSLIIFSTGGWILIRSVHAVIDGVHEVPAAMAVAAAFLTIITKEALYRYSITAGKKLGSPAILAVARDHRKDAITSVSTLVGVTGAFFGLTVMDPIAAGITSLFIFHIGHKTFMGAAHELMDGKPDDNCLEDIRNIAEGVAGVEHVHEIRCRRSGQYLIVDLKLDMNPEMTVRESHAIATAVKKLIFERAVNVGDVMIHINPHEDEHQDLIRL